MAADARQAKIHRWKLKRGELSFEHSSYPHRSFPLFFTKGEYFRQSWQKNKEFCPSSFILHLSTSFRWKSRNLWMSFISRFTAGPCRRLLASLIFLSAQFYSSWCFNWTSALSYDLSIPHIPAWLLASGCFQLACRLFCSQGCYQKHLSQISLLFLKVSGSCCNCYSTVPVGDLN